MTKRLLLGVLITLNMLHMPAQAVDPVQAINDVTRNLTALIDTLVLTRPDIATQIKQAIDGTVKIRAFSACKGKSKTTQIKSKSGELILTCGDVAAPLSVVRDFVLIVKDKLLGSQAKPGILYATLGIIGAVGVDTSQVRSVVNTIESLLSSIESLLKVLSKDLQVKEPAK